MWCRASCAAKLPLDQFMLRIPFFVYEDWGAQANVKEAVLRTCEYLRFAITPKYDRVGNLSVDSDSVTVWIDDIRFIGKK